MTDDQQAARAPGQPAVVTLPTKVDTAASRSLRGQPRKATIATTLFRDKIEQFKG